MAWVLGSGPTRPWHFRGVSGFRKAVASPGNIEVMESCQRPRARKMSRPFCACAYLRGRSLAQWLPAYRGPDSRPLAPAPIRDDRSACIKTTRSHDYRRIGMLVPDIGTSAYKKEIALWRFATSAIPRLSLASETRPDSRFLSARSNARNSTSSGIAHANFSSCHDFE